MHGFINLIPDFLFFFGFFGNYHCLCLQLWKRPSSLLSFLPPPPPHLTQEQWINVTQPGDLNQSINQLYLRNNHPVGDPLKHSREVWVEMFRQSLRNLTLLKPKKKFILLHSLRQETPFYDPESFRFAYVDIMELNVLENNCQCYKCRLLISQQHLKPDAKLS